ncbi:Uncharacterised protein [Klebsiella michiganensis]|nr:Uncharacterised protein [Klebsiella michiganensis]
MLFLDICCSTKSLIKLFTFTAGDSYFLLIFIQKLIAFFQFTVIHAPVLLLYHPPFDYLLKE